MLGIKKIVNDFMEPTPGQEDVTTSDSSAAPVSGQSDEIESKVADSNVAAATTSSTGGTMTQSTDHAEEVVNTTLHKHTTEEVEHQTEVERHQNIVNVIEQPLKEEEHIQGSVSENVEPTLEVEENHAASDDDKKALENITQEFEQKGGQQVGSNEKTVIDKGETINETVHTHVQNVVVPVVDKDVHEHNKIKTVVPTHQVINEAPVIQKSTSTLEPMSREEYENKQGANTVPIQSLEDGTYLSQQGGESERKIVGVE